MEAKSPVDYSHYIENENAALPATAIHRHAQAGYHTTRPGEKLVPGITMDFDLSDPFFTEYKPGEYKPLHDPHLKHFLNKKSVRRCLMKNNFITKDGEVRCTLQEFNRFQRNLKHYFKTQKRIASALEKKKFYVDPRKVLRHKVKSDMLQKRIQHNVKIAEAKARRTESMMKRRKQILNNIVLKQRQMTQMIERARLEREKADGQFEMERKMRELIKIRLDSCELIRRSSILQKIRQKERIVSQKQMLKRQRRLKEITRQHLVWHKERMDAKDEEMIKFLDEDNEKKDKRRQSIAARTHHSELHRANVNEQQKKVFENHVRIEDTHLDEAKEWERKVQNNRVKAASNWRAKMHCMQTIAEGRMADIERRKYDRKRNAAARKAAKIEESLDVLEKMDVTVLGTTGCGSPELANIHRDNSRIRFSAYYDPCRDMIDPCRTTKFHAHFKPFTVVHAKYQPGQHPPSPVRKTRSRNSSTQIKQIHHVPISTKLSKDSSSLSKSTCSSSSNLSAGFVDDLLSELIATELRDVITECQEETESELVVDSLIDKILDDVVDTAMVKVSKGLVDNVITSALDSVMQPTPSSADQKTVRIMSNFSCLSDSSPEWSESYSTGSSLEVADLVEDVVRKIMKCFDGDHREVYPGQTSTTDCRTKDGEEIITDIITRLVGTVQNFTRCTGTVTPITESTESLLSSGQPSRESLKDLHKRAQFLLNHALDIARVKLKLSGYSYLTWNIMEDCLQKGREKLLYENSDTIAQLSDVEVVEWIMEEAKKFLQDATTLMYDMMHGDGDDEVAKIESVERRYLEQLEKSDQAFNPEMIDEAMLEEVAAEGDVAKFAVLLVKRTLHEATTSIPRRSSVMLSEALRDGNFDLAGSIMAAKAITVAHKELVLDPQKPAEMQLKQALREGDISTAGTLLAHRAIQQAMNINLNEPEFAEKSISTMILEVALDQGDLETAGKVVIGSSLREALKYINTPTPDISLDQALKYGDLEIAGTIITDIVLEQGLHQIYEEDCQLRRESSIALENALYTGDVPAAGEILTSRLLKSGMSQLEDEVDDKLVDQILNSPSKMGDLEKMISNKSSVILRGALAAGDFEAAAPILINRAFRVVNEEDKKEQNENVIPMSSSEVLKGALKSGDLETAAPVLANRAIRSAQGGNVENKTQDDNVIPMSSSEILRGALTTGDLEAAAPVLANRALRSAMSGDGDCPENEPELSNNEEKVVAISSSERILQGALETGNLDDAAPVLANRALKSAMSGEDDGNDDEQNNDWSSNSVENITSSANTGVCSTQDIQNQRSEGIVVPVNSYEELKIVKTSSCLGEEIEPSFEEGIYYLEAFKKTNIDEKTYERGEAFVQSILNDLTTKYEVIFGDDIRNDCRMLKPSLIKSDYNGAGNVLVKSLLDNIRLETLPKIETAMDRTKFASLLSRLVFQKCLETIRGGPGSDMTRICEHINDHIRKTLSVIYVTAGSDAIISMVIGKCLKLVTGNAGKDVRGRSSIELFEACMSGDTAVAGGILTQKVLKKAEEDAAQVDVSTFKSTDEILSEKHVSDGSTKPSASSTSIRSAKSKKKINTEGLPMPKPLSFTKSRSNTAVSSKSDYEPIRELLMSEEREFMVNQIVSQSERSIENQRAQSAKSLVAKSSKNLSRKESIAVSIERLADFCDQKLKERPLDVGDRLTVNSSDESLPLQSDDSFSNESLGYVRKIQSKGYIYYINEDGVIKKRARKKRTSKKRLSQDDLNGISELDSKDREQEDSLEPKAVSSETSLLKSSDLPSISSKKSIRSTIKKKDSSLQVLAVINSSYTNMLGRKTSGEAVENRESEAQATSSDTKTKPSIDEMLSETDKELIKKLSCASVEEKQTES